MRALVRAWRRAPASLGAKLVLILTGAGLAGALAITLLLALVITPSFDRLEQAAVTSHVDQARAALDGYAERVEVAARDYGDWSASYNFMVRRTEAFAQESFSPAALTGLGVDGAAFVAPDGQVLAARWIGRPAPLATTLGRIDLSRALADKRSSRFYLRAGRQLVAVGVAQVRRSDGSGTPRGHVVLARTLPSSRMAELLKFDARVVAAESAGVEVIAGRRADHVLVPLAGPDGRAVAGVEFPVRREATLLGRRMLLLAVGGSTLLLLLLLVVLRRMIARHVIEPLHRVEAHMQRVRTSGSLAPLTDLDRGDEIGALGNSFNAMLTQLKDLRERNEAQSFALGRSESAVAVMHNVRNALNPVTTVLSQSLGQTSPVEREMLDRAMAELAGDGIPVARRQKLSAFVVAGLHAWAESREALRRELAIGREAMAHALEIIGLQQREAHGRPAPEPCDVAEIVARNAAIARYGELASIAFSFPSAPVWVHANRVVLSQVIGNLFANAAEAIAATGRGSGSIAVTAECAGDVVLVRIADNGEGFAPAVGATLFQRGFSTRNHKSGGLGLHWCANSMTAMEGALRLESAGHGLGAIATLTLPAAEAMRAAA